MRVAYERMWNKLLESIKPLRDKGYIPGFRGAPTLEMVVDDIEKEISERYVLLPVDADGVPIHVGDSITLPNGSRDNVRFITIREHDMVFNERGWVPGKCTHTKPRTLEDVLHDFANEAEWEQSSDSYEEIESRLITLYAAEIREMIGGEL